MAVISSLASVSLANPTGTTFPEIYLPIWWYSGGTYAFAGNILQFVLKGATAGSSASETSATDLFVCNFPSGTQSALEVYLAGTSSSSAVIELYDFTAGSDVSGSSITTNNKGVFRSGKFTLENGHTYGLHPNCTVNSYTNFFTDASLIIFPDAPLTNPSVSAISLANPSGNTLKESYIPLWVYSSGSIGTSTGTVSSPNLIAKGTTSYLYGTLANNPSTVLYTLSSNWSPSQSFALEAVIWDSATGQTGYAELWDLTSNAAVSGASVNTTATSATVVRSGKFTLDGSHKYGIALYTSSGTISVYLTKAYLVALGG